MPQLVEHLAELTGFRDRDVLDVTLVGALRDLLHPLALAVYRLVEDGGGPRWITRARLSQTELVAVADSAWTELDQLPRLDEHPRRRDCLHRQQVLVETHGAMVRTCFPLDTDREVVGVLEIDSAGPLSDEQRRLVTAILRIYRNFQGLLDYSERDTLTGLLNRKTFDEAFLKTASAGDGPPADALHQPPERRRDAAPGWWLAVVDIDHFKRVNDNHGHLIGDEVLLLLSRLMRGCFRFHDRLYRFGGEEFVVLLRCHGEDEAAQALERLRRTTETYPFPQVGCITVSVGFTPVRTTDTPSAAFERADKAVYWAKAHGRNQVCSHRHLVSAGAVEDEAGRTGDVELF